MSNRALTRRQLLSGMAAGLIAAAVSSCAPKQAAQPTQAAPKAQQPTQPAPKDKIKITLWSSFSGENGEAEIAIVDMFNEKQDEIEVDYQFQGNYEETAQKLTAALQAKTEPHISLMSDVWWFKFYLNQVIAPLDDLLAASNIDVSDYQDSLIDEGVRQGVHYWIPFARSTPLFYYNREIWDEAGLPDRGPKTWMEFEEWAPKLTIKEGEQFQRAAFVHPDGASYIAWLFQGVAWQFGGKYSDPDFTMHMTHDETLRAGQFYADTVHKFGWAYPSKDIGVDFVNGLTAAAMMSTGSMGGIRANAAFEFGTAFLPEEEHFGCCTGGAGLSILNSASADAKQAAMDYIGFATDAESTSFWAKSTGYMPVCKSAFDTQEMKSWFAEFPQFRTAVDQLAKTQPQDSARVFVPNGDQIIGKGLERITVEAGDVKAAFGDVQKTLEKEAEPVVAALKKIEN
jgi:sn-glycerol 3-phosphate transport system substrate-binding protein